MPASPAPTPGAARGGAASGSAPISGSGWLVSARPRLLLASALLAVVSLGLPWTPILLGSQHPVRALAVLGAAGLYWGLRRGSHPLAWAGLAVAALALPLEPTGDHLPSGRLVYALALVVAAVAISAGAGQRDS